MKFLNKLANLTNKRLLIAALACGLATTVIAGATGTAAYAEDVQSGIADNVIRFHIRANSDSDADQALKMLVKNAVIDALHDGLAASTSLDETRAYIAENLETVKLTAEEVIAQNGYSYPVSVCLCHDYFPTKIYGDVTLPPGIYEALRVDIGAAVGHNWWCVMFPPLCFVDVTEAQIPDSDKQQLKNVLTDEGYSLVTRQSTPVKIKFKIVELWEEWFNQGKS